MSKTKFQYPETRRMDHIDVIHGVEVPDPYRWLEDIDSDETRSWIEAQNKITFNYLEGLTKRKQIAERMTELFDYEKYGIPVEKAGRYFYTYNNGLRNQPELVYTEGIDGEPKTLLDPNDLSEDGTIALMGYSVSKDGNFLAYGLADAGSDWQEWRIRDIEKGENLDDHLKWIKFTLASWTPDNQGFYYSRYDEPMGELLKEANYYQKIFFHQVGTSQSKDMLIYNRDDHKDWRFSGEVSEDGAYLVITVTHGTHPENDVFLLDLIGNGDVVELIQGFKAKYHYITNNDTVFYFLTDHDAPMGKVISLDLSQPDKTTDIIPESEHAINTVSYVGGKFITLYLHDAYSKVTIFDSTGTNLKDLDLPTMGRVTGFTGGKDDTESFFHFTSFTYPGTIYRINLSKNDVDVYREPRIGFNPSDYTTDQVFYESKDGTQVPMYISYRKGTEPKTNQPAYLYAYGGFNIAQTPYFNVRNLVWMEMGGIFALPNIRGGDEYGKPWHDQGIKLKKQNVFDDFIAAAEYLISEGYTSTPKLAISGRSNGGLLAGACLTQRPELYGVTVPVVGVLDMIRFEKFTVGWGWTSDYGSVEKEDEFNALLAYSPYHNVKDGTSYPPTLITTGDHDDRVYPAHSYKFAAAMQNANTGDNPILIRIDTRAGHGGGKPTGKLIEEYTDELVFIVDNLEMEADN